MKKVIAMLLVLTLALFCASALAQEDEKAFTIVLTSNPTTGYTWQHVLSEDGVVTVEEEFLTSADIDKLAGIQPSNEFMAGQGGLSVFTIKGVKPGSVVLALEYGQSWEQDDAEAGVTYFLRVNEDLSVVCTASALGVDD